MSIWQRIDLPDLINEGGGLVLTNVDKQFEFSGAIKVSLPPTSAAPKAVSLRVIAAVAPPASTTTLQIRLGAHEKTINLNSSFLPQTASFTLLGDRPNDLVITATDPTGSSVQIEDL